MNLKKYAIAGYAYAINCLPKEAMAKLRGVFLFGSIAIGSANRESDVDIFFDIDLPARQQSLVRKSIIGSFDAFRLSSQGLSFKMQGISNRFSPIVGRLGEWKGISRSISLSGIQLYGAARIVQAKGEPWLIFSWERIPLDRRGAFLNAAYGYKVKEKRYPGVVKLARGFRIGKSAIAIPAASSQGFQELLGKYKIEHTVKEWFR